MAATCFDRQLLGQRTRQEFQGERRKTIAMSSKTKEAHVAEKTRREQRGHMPTRTTRQRGPGNERRGHRQEKSRDNVIMTLSKKEQREKVTRGQQTGSKAKRATQKKTGRSMIKQLSDNDGDVIHISA